MDVLAYRNLLHRVYPSFVRIPGTVYKTTGYLIHCPRNSPTVSAPAAATAGTAFNFTVTALDQTNAIVTGYSGTVHFTSSDGASVLPANATLTNGTGTFSATLKTTGSQTITATDTVTSSITGTSGAIAVSVVSTTYNIVVSASPVADGSVTGGGTYAGNSTVTVNAIANTGYHFVNWTEGNNVVSTSPSYSFIATANRTLVANFAVNQYTVNFIAGPGGCLTGTTNQIVNYGGSTTKVTANPAYGYQFVNWTDAGNNVVSSAAALIVTNVTVNMTLTANFAVTCTPDLSLSADKSSPQRVGSQITFTATIKGKSCNYQFQFWLRNPQGSWSLVRGSSLSPTWTWKTNGSMAGTYYIKVCACKVGSKPPIETCKIMSYTLLKCLK